jgi:outer membrane protein assembly factor BamE
MRYFSSLRYLVISLVLLTSACGTALPTVKPYKLDVQQGNVVTSKMLLQLRPGMTKSQVRFIMGTPLIQDSFHGNRWDYVYQMREGGKITEQRRVILDFENELLKSVRGDVIPAGSDKSKSEESQVNTGTRVVEPYKKPEEKSWMSRLKFWGDDEAALAKEKTAKEVAVAVDAKAESEAAVSRMDAAPTNQIAPSADAKVAESNSMLAVPIEVAPIVAAPAVEMMQSDAPAASATSANVVAPADQVTHVESVIAAVQTPVVEAGPVANMEQTAVKAPVYESSSGMIFDRNLRYIPDEPEPEVKAVEATPRVGNKEIPNPKALPPESEPSFFDRMLEKIGF